MGDLAVEVALLYPVVVDNAQPAHPGSGQIEGGRTA
jgi:hypothetical protein